MLGALVLLPARVQGQSAKHEVMATIEKMFDGTAANQGSFANSRGNSFYLHGIIAELSLDFSVLDTDNGVSERKRGRALCQN